MMSRRQSLLEIALVFAVFALQGAWPVPEVNEPYYLGKMIHFWNPEWVTNDFFLDTADAHSVFFFTLGWLSLWMSPTAVAWLLRALTWALLAVAWQRLSAAVVPRRWFSVVTAILFLFLLQHFNTAGEWVIGGAEAKGFAFVLVLLGLEALVRGRWNRMWLLFGAASAFHVLVGGWSTLAAGLVWLVQAAQERRWKGETGQTIPSMSAPPSLRSMAPALAGGLLLALPGLIPGLRLDLGAAAPLARRAHEIYVYDRLPHHLDPLRFPMEFVIPFMLMCVAWLALGRMRDTGATLGATTMVPMVPGLPSSAEDTVGQANRGTRHFRSADGPRRLRGFVNAAICIAIAGLGIRLVGLCAPDMAAGLLRFYWFRLSDVAVPLGVALVGVYWIAGLGSRRALAALIVLAVFHVSDCAVLRWFSTSPNAERVPQVQAWCSAARWLTGQGSVHRQSRADRLPDYPAWRAACDWIDQSGQIPAGARFLTPRMSQTFRWYAHRAEVTNWKEIPQDAAGLIRWWDRIQDIYATANCWSEEIPIVGDQRPPDRYYESLADLGAKRLRALGRIYEADYAITMLTDPVVPLPVVYKNSAYIIYKIRS